MKILILTQPLHTNYGGLMQAYALQRVLIEMGHDVYTDKPKPIFISLRSKLSIWIPIRFVLKYLLFRNVEYIIPFSLSKKQHKIITQNTERFVFENIKTIDFFEGKKKPKKSKIDLFDAYVVGSDQVWRPIYSLNIYSYFLDFVNYSNVKKIAYAASFGVDNWEYDDKTTNKCKSLISDFHSISVREYSGVDLCKNYLNVNADLVLDPTMLLKKQDYLQLINVENVNKISGDLMYYILDNNDSKKEVLNTISSLLQYESFNSMPVENVKKIYKNDLDLCIYPSPTSWIYCFNNAKFVVTDSFHGVVFSIIFNVPFIAIANKERGLTRFLTLLKQFGLENRLVESIDEVNRELILSKIDFDDVNTKLNVLQKKSLNFIFNSLK